MRKSWRLVWGLAWGLAIAAPLAAQERGLAVSDHALGGPRWQARFERDGKLPTLRLLGDWQFSTLRLGATGGLRLTGGLLVNLNTQRLPGLAPEPLLPLSGMGYAGVGYASGGLHGDWGFSADLGVAGPRFGMSRRSVDAVGSAATDAGLRDIGLQPVLRLGMSLQF